MVVVVVVLLVLGSSSSTSTAPWCSRSPVGGGAQAKAELGPDLPTPGVQGQGGLAPRPPHPREGVVEGGGLRPVGVEAVVEHGGGGGGHDGGSFTAGPAILAACCL